ncbi:MAG: hypothetical protein MJ252_24090 [archaeon]|nr:hypothetical protein [archaeon]
MLNENELFEQYLECCKEEFKCPKCLKNYSTKGNLKNHFQTIHLQICPFKCTFEGCTKSFSSKSKLEVHLKFHEEERPFVCEICNKAFKAKIHLKTHLQFHTDKRPFKCSLCSKDYKTKGHLKDHIKSFHEGIKEFECLICHRFFNRKSSLNAHKKLHLREKIFICENNGTFESETNTEEIIKKEKDIKISTEEDKTLCALNSNPNSPTNSSPLYYQHEEENNLDDNCLNYLIREKAEKENFVPLCCDYFEKDKNYFGLNTNEEEEEKNLESKNSYKIRLEGIYHPMEEGFWLNLQL